MKPYADAISPRETSFIGINDTQRKARDSLSTNGTREVTSALEISREHITSIEESNVRYERLAGPISHGVHCTERNPTTFFILTKKLEMLRILQMRNLSTPTGKPFWS